MTSCDLDRSKMMEKKDLKLSESFIMEKHESSFDKRAETLLPMVYFVPTPIGNLEDITLRALRILREADVLYCEDTRHTRKLLAHFGIHAELRCYEKHREREATEEILLLLEEGKSIAVVSDAGMPGFSDPGSVLIDALKRETRAFTVLPGPNAAATAWVASGWSESSFCFFGFLPRRGKERKSQLQHIAHAPQGQIFYEAPHRIASTLKELASYMTDRSDACVMTARELTKKFEEYRWWTPKEILQTEAEYIESRGEYVVVIAPYVQSLEVDEETLKTAVQQCLLEGMRLKEAAAHVAEHYQVSKNQVYTLGLSIKNESN